MEMFKCEGCGKEFKTKQARGGHKPFCDANPNKERNRELASYFISKNIEDRWGEVKQRNIECLECKKIFVFKCTDKKFQEGEIPRFCCHSCSASFNNKTRKRVPDRECLNCGKMFVSGKNTNGDDKKYCSQKCCGEYVHKQWLSNYLENQDTIKILTNALRDYLLELHDHKCSRCGWNEINPFSNRHPLEIEHIDGNSENNRLDNLTVLCPNCHSLTSTYKGLNAGKGRHSRRLRYRSGKSY